MKRDLSRDVKTTHLNESNFDFGINLEYNFLEAEPDVDKYLDQYVTLSVTQNIYTWVYDEKKKANAFNKTKIETIMGPCNEGRLGITNSSKDYLGIRNSYLCPQDFNYQI